MNREAAKALLILIIRLVVAGIFVRAALPKIDAPSAFASAVQGFQIVSVSFSVWVAIILPWTELVAGIGLLVPAIRRGSGLILSVLLISFIALHASAWARGLDISCGCFGTESVTTSRYPWFITRNALLLAATILVVIRDFKAATKPENVPPCS